MTLRVGDNLDSIVANAESHNSFHVGSWSW